MKNFNPADLLTMNEDGQIASPGKGMNVWGTYDDEIDKRRSGDVPLSQYAKPIALPQYLDTDLRLDYQNEDLIWHEAAHAIVGHHVGMTVQFIDMSGLLIPSPVCGLDVNTVPEADRPAAVALAALAGPIGECWKSNRKPSWRMQDGDVARAQAKLLKPEDMSAQMLLLMDWVIATRQVLQASRAYEPLAKLLARERMLSGAAFYELIDMYK